MKTFSDSAERLPIRLAYYLNPFSWILKRGSAEGECKDTFYSIGLKNLAERKLTANYYFKPFHLLKV